MNSSKQQEFRTVKLIIVLLVLTVVVLAGWQLRGRAQQHDITSFSMCAAAGFPIKETYPEQCATPDGKVFTNQLPTSQ